MKRFYSTDITPDLIRLHDSEAQHCSKVLRCQTGETVEVMDGKGNLYEGKISVIARSVVEISAIVLKKKLSENPNRLYIAICPTKNPSRLEWFLEKATEIGVAGIYPMISQRTEKLHLKTERLQHILVAAVKQSGQLFVPELHPLQSVEQVFTATVGLADQYMIAHCLPGTQHLKQVYRAGQKVLLLIGPEGDFTEAEILEAVNKNYIPVSLGNSILRVETAGVAACAMISLLNQP